MSLGISLNGKCAWWKFATPARVAKYLAASHTHPLKKYFRIEKIENGFCAYFQPAENTVDFTFEGSGKISVSARTSGGGPGYHAWFVRQMRDLQKRFSITWDNETSFDETDYWNTGDFAELQTAMADQVKAVFYSMREPGKHHFGLPLGFPMAANDENWSIDNFGRVDVEKTIQDVETDKRNANARVAWWEIGPDDAYFHQCARSLLGIEFRWEPVMDRVEAKVCDSILECLEKTKQPAPWLVRGAQEARAALAGKTPAIDTTICLRSGDGVFLLVEGWSAVFPGTAYATMDGDTSVFLAEGMTIRFRFYQNPKRDDPNFLDTVATKGSEILVKDSDRTIWCYFCKPDDAWLVQCVAISQESSALVTIALADLSQKDRAIQIARSLKRPQD